jgi:hypothetical protein
MSSRGKSAPLQPPHAGSLARRAVAFDPREGLPNVLLKKQGRLLRATLVEPGRGVQVVDPIALNMYDKRSGEGESGLAGALMSGDTVLFLLSPKDMEDLDVGGHLGDLIQKSTVEVYLPVEFPGKRFSEVVDALLLDQTKVVQALMLDDVDADYGLPDSVEENRWLAVTIAILSRGLWPDAAALALAIDLFSSAGMASFATFADQIDFHQADDAEDLKQILRHNKGDNQVFLACMWVIKQTRHGETSIDDESIEEVSALAKKIGKQDIINKLSPRIGAEVLRLPFGRDVPFVGGLRLKTFVPDMTAADEDIVVENA